MSCGAIPAERFSPSQTWQRGHASSCWEACGALRPFPWRKDNLPQIQAISYPQQSDDSARNQMYVTPCLWADSSRLPGLPSTAQGKVYFLYMWQTHVTDSEVYFARHLRQTATLVLPIRYLASQLRSKK